MSEDLLCICSQRQSYYAGAADGMPSTTSVSFIVTVLYDFVVIKSACCTQNCLVSLK